MAKPIGETEETGLRMLEALRRDLSDAADIILSSAETGFEQLAALKAGDRTRIEALEQLFCTILGACSFQDLAGQRLCQIETFLNGAGAKSSDPLMNGPSLHGHGLDQAGADALFEAAQPVL